MSEENKALARRFVEEFVNNRDESAVDETCTEDFVDYNPFAPDGKIVGSGAIKHALGHLRGAFPDLKAEIHDVLSDGDKVVVRSQLTGTQTGEFLGFPASGKKMDIKQIDIFRVVDGKLAERWGVFEGLNLATQMGLLEKRTPLGAGRQ